MRILSFRLATSTTSVLTTAIPTVSRVIGPPNPYNYWWLRSPYTDYIGDYYYGAWHVTSLGAVGVSYNVVIDSYGRIYFSPDSFMYYNYTSFYVIEDGSMSTYAVEYSYGRRSPLTDGTFNAWRVNPSGDVSIGFVNVTGSYGFIRINLSIITEK